MGKLFKVYRIQQIHAQTKRYKGHAKDLNVRELYQILFIL